MSVLVVLTGLASAAGSSAAAKPQVQVTAIAGSSSYLVFARFGLNDKGQPAKVGALVTMDRSGKTRKLTDIPRDYLELGPPTLAGHMLLAPFVTAIGKFKLINLRSGQHKTLTYKSQTGVTPIAAAPNGYLGFVTGSSPTRIVRVSWSGSRTSFGAPFKDCRDVNIETGPTGFLAIGAGDDPTENSCQANDIGERSARFAKPGRYHTLAALQPNVDSPDCNTTGSPYVVCVRPQCRVTIETLTGQVRHRLSTSAVRCLSSLAVSDDRIFWLSEVVNKGSRLYELNVKKLTRASGYLPNDQDPVAAFGKIVVPQLGRHHLLEYASAHAKARRLV